SSQYTGLVWMYHVPHRLRALRRPQLRAATTWIAVHLRIGWPNRLLRQRRQTRVAAKRLLHAAVFQRMKADNHKSAPRSKVVRNYPQRGFQRFKLSIHGNPQGLKSSCRRIDSIGRTRNALTHKLSQIARRCDRPLPPPLNDPPGNPPATPVFAKL